MVYAKDHLYLTDKVIELEIKSQIELKALWESYVRRSFLSDEEKQAYIEILNERMQRFENG